MVTHFIKQTKTYFIKIIIYFAQYKMSNHKLFKNEFYNIKTLKQIKPKKAFVHIHRNYGNLFQLDNIYIL